jgi:hypothetical protein
MLAPRLKPSEPLVTAEPTPPHPTATKMTEQENRKTGKTRDGMA